MRQHRDAGGTGEARVETLVGGADDLGDGRVAGGEPRQDRSLPRGVGIIDPLIQAAAADRVVHLPRPVAGQHDDGRHGGADGAVFRDGDLEVGQQFQQERLERLVGAVQLVDQQHGGRLVRVDGGQQRPGL